MIIGLLFSSISCLLILFDLKKLEYKDFSTELRIYSTFIDIGLIFSLLLVIVLWNEREWCLLNSIYIMCNTSHEL